MTNQDRITTIYDLIVQLHSEYIGLICECILHIITKIRNLDMRIIIMIIGIWCVINRIRPMNVSTIKYAHHIKSIEVYDKQLSKIYSDAKNIVIGSIIMTTNEGALSVSQCNSKIELSKAYELKGVTLLRSSIANTHVYDNVLVNVTKTEYVNFDKWLLGDIECKYYSKMDVYDGGIKKCDLRKSNKRAALGITDFADLNAVSYLISINPYNSESVPNGYYNINNYCYIAVLYHVSKIN